jgi:hypothetical protein
VSVALDGGVDAAAFTAMRRVDAASGDADAQVAASCSGRGHCYESVKAEVAAASVTVARTRNALVKLRTAKSACRRASLRHHVAEHDRYARRTSSALLYNKVKRLSVQPLAAAAAEAGARRTRLAEKVTHAALTATALPKAVSPTVMRVRRILFAMNRARSSISTVARTTRVKTTKTVIQAPARMDDVSTRPIAASPRAVADSASLNHSVNREKHYVSIFMLRDFGFGFIELHGDTAELFTSRHTDLLQSDG